MAVSLRSKVVASAAIVAMIFGVATVAAGTRVLLGADPGYVVFRPLLLFNTAMGFAYVIVGVLAWKRSGLGARGAGLVAVLNLAVLVAIALLYTADRPIAINSLKAMAFRTIVWVVLFLVLFLASRQASPESRNAG
jgi:hypothetical protein